MMKSPVMEEKMNHLLEQTRRKMQGIESSDESPVEMVAANNDFSSALPHYGQPRSVTP